VQPVEPKPQRREPLDPPSVLAFRRVYRSCRPVLSCCVRHAAWGVADRAAVRRTH